MTACVHPTVQLYRTLPIVVGVVRRLGDMVNWSSDREVAQMTLIQKSVTINAPVDKALAVLEDPERQTERRSSVKSNDLLSRDLFTP